MKNIPKIICIALVFFICLTALPAFPAATASGEEFNIVKDVLWDIDFEDETIDSTLSPVVSVCGADGYPLGSSRGDKFCCHTGSSANSIVISDGALKLNPSNTTEYVQTNEFYSTISEGEAVFKYRVKVDDYKSTKFVYRLVYLGEDGKTYWSPQYCIKQNVGFMANQLLQDTEFAVFDGTDGATFDINKTAACKKGTWYNIEARINFENNSFEYKLDSEVIASGTLGKPIASTVRVSLACEINESEAAASPLYIDDIFIYEATDKPQAKLNIYIDGTAAKRITEGTLSAGATFSPGYGNSVDVVFALYRGSKLADVRLIKSTIIDSTIETVIPPVDFGCVDETVTLKLIAVSSLDNLKPLCNAIVADNVGMSTEVIDTDTLISIFESDSEYNEILNGKIGYHPDSGLITQNSMKKQTSFKGETENGVIMVPAELMAQLGAETKSDSSFASVDGAEFTEGSSVARLGSSQISLEVAPYSKNGVLYIPLCDTVQKVLNKNCYITCEGDNAGAVVIGDDPFDTSDIDIQKLNYYLLYERPSKEKVLSYYKASSLAGVHPRVIMTEADFDRVRNAKDNKTVYNRKRIISIADSYLDDEVLFYEIRDGVRLWYVSMDFMDRVMALAFAYRLTGDTKYLDKCTKEMDSIASFPSWHPEHHIDVGGLAVGFGIGYDWLYDSLTPKQKSRYESAVYELCYDEYYKGFTDKSDYMKGGILAVNNHNSVMNSGITICALAFMDAFPYEGAYFIENSLKATEITLTNFAPDGAWYEGVGYGCMTLEYMALQLSALKTAFGNCFCLDAAEGMDMAARFVVNMQTPTGAFAFYDGGSTNIQWHSGALWFAEHFGDSLTVNEWYNHYNVVEDARATAAFLMYYNPESLYDSQIKETRWNLDFENLKSGEHRWGYPYVSVYNSDGSLLYSSGDSLTAHTGTTANTIEIADTGDASHKRALNIKAADNATSQLNEFLASPSGDAVVYEFDYMIEALPDSPENSEIVVMSPVLSAGKWLSSLKLKANDGYASFVFGSSVKETEINRWYNIRAVADMARRRIEYYIDDVYFGSSAIESGLTKSQKIVSKLIGAAGASVWIDNFKVYSLSHSDAADDADKDVFYSKNDVITSRDSWLSDEPVFFGAKGGFAADAHGHMDMGTFTFFSNGVRWLEDYGAENYNLPGFWSGGSRDSMRWQYFAMRAEAHNCLVINPDLYGEYDPMAKAEFVRYENSDEGVIAVLDMTAVHAGKAESARRGYFFTDSRKSLVVRDEVTVAQSSDLYFFLQTSHNVSVSGNIVTISDKSDSSKYITVEFACDQEFEINVGDAVPLPTSPSPDGLMSTEGKTRIYLKTTTSGDTSITAKFTPHNVSGSNIADYIKNMDSWTING